MLAFKLDAQHGGIHRTYISSGPNLLVNCIHHLGSLRCCTVEHEDIVTLLARLHRVLRIVIDTVKILNVLVVHLWEVSITLPLPLHNQPALTQLVVQP